MLDQTRSSCRLLVLLLAAVAAAPLPAQQKTGQQKTGQVVTKDRLVDHDYAFEIKRPGKTWTILPEEQIRKILPVAAAGIRSLRGVQGGVIAESAPGVDLRVFADLLLDAMPLENEKLVEKKSIEYQGCPAVRFVVVGTVNGLRARYRNIVAQRGDYVFQVLAMGLETALDEVGDLDMFAASVSFIPGKITGRSRRGVPEDRYGVGWRVESGTFESAALRLRVGPEKGWNLLIGDELAKINPAAEVGLRDDSAQCYIIVIPEVAAVEDRKPVVERAREGLAAGLGLEPSGQVEHDLGGAKRRFDVYDLKTVPFRYLHGVWFHEDICYQVIAWFAVAAVEHATKVLPTGLASVRFTSQDDAKRLGSALAARPDPQEVVGGGSSLRNGVYRDFDSGFEWRRPRAGFWRVVAGQGARARGKDVSLALEETSRGITGVVLVERFEGKLEDYTALVRENLRGAGVELDEKLGTTSSGELEGLRSKGIAWSGKTRIAYDVTCFLRGSTAVRVVLHGVSENVAASADSISAVLKGVRLRPEKLARTQVASGQYRDWRLGYAVDLTGDGDPMDVTPPSMAEIGTVVVFREDECLLLCLAVHATVDTADESLLINAAKAGARAYFPPALGELEPESFTSTLAGLPATGLRWEGDGGDCAELLVIKRGKTFYGVMTGADAGGELPSAGVFHLLD